MTPRIHADFLPYIDRLQPRDRQTLTTVVIHCTELPDLAMAREYGERIVHDEGTGNSGHYYVDRDGGLHAWVPTDRTAHHVRGHNARTIGIELVNTGRYPNWWDSRHQAMTEAYPPTQIDALRALLAHLRATHPKLTSIAGHEDLDTVRVPASDDASLQVPRKRDPGPLFPWEAVLRDSGLQRTRGDDATP